MVGNIHHPHRIEIGPETVAVDKDMVRTHRKSVQSALHARYRGVEYVYPVYLLCIYHNDGPGHSLSLYLLAQTLACGSRKLL